MSKKKFSLFISLLFFFTFICPLCAIKVSAYTNDFVYTKDGHFMLNGEPFYHSGTNNYYLNYKPNSMIDDVLKSASKMNLKVIRSWGFLDGATHDGYVMQPALGVYADDHPELYPKSGFERLDYAISKAQPLGIKFVFTLVNYWSDFGGMPQYTAWTGAGGDATAFYTNADCITAYKNYAKHFLNHKNQYTGVQYKNDPTIMAIQLANEPRNSSDSTGKSLTKWADDMSTYIRSIDSNHLISVGDEGFYNRPGAYVDGQHNGQDGVDWEKLVALANISYGTVHDYGNSSWGHDSAWSLKWAADHIKDGHALGKPVIIEEFGSKNRTTRDAEFTAYTNEIQKSGGDAAYSWMLVGLNEDTPPVYYDTLWDDGFQFNITSTTATVLKNHATFQNNLNVASAPESFTQTLPAIGVTNVSAQPEFSWVASKGASSYSLVVSTKNDYSNPIVNETNITSTSYSTKIPLDYSTVYYWKVTANNYIGSTTASNKDISFTTQSQPPMPKVFSQSEPEVGAIGVSTSPTFTWEASDNADRYSLVVSTSNTFTNPIINVSDLTTTSYTDTTALSNGTTYYWKVTSTNLTGSTSASNEGVSFTTQLPSPIIDNFDTYNGLTANLQSSYVKNSNGNAVTLALDATNKSNGAYGMAYTYTVGSPNYVGIAKSLNGSSFKGYNGIKFWLKPDGTTRTLTIQFKETSGEYWESYYTTSGTTASTVYIPFTSFVNPKWSSAVNGVIDKDSIAEYAIFIGQDPGTAGTGTIYLDDIMLSNKEISNTDTEAPTAPTTLASPSKTSNSVNLTWTTATDNVGVTGYDIYNGSTVVGSSTTTNYTVTGLNANTAYSFSVKAKDAAGNVSAASSEFTVTTNSKAIASIKVLYQCSETKITTNSLRPDFKIVNTGIDTINLSDIKVRYWYTNDSKKAQISSIYWSSVGNSNIGTSFVEMLSAKPTADNYVEFGFVSSKEKLAPGASVEVKVGINTTDWSNYNQSNDYSFNSATTGLVENNKFTGYISGDLQWGIEP